MNIERQTSIYLSENICAKLVVTTLAGVILFAFRLFGIPEDDVHCLDDRVHDALNPVNQFLNQHIAYTNAMIVLSSFFMDVISLATFGYWLLCVRNTRFMLTIILFYSVRSV